MSGVTYVAPPSYDHVGLLRRARYIARVTQRFAGRLSLVVLLLLLAGTMEAIGIASLLPVLSILTGNPAAEPSALEVGALYVLGFLHLSPKLGTLLAASVVGFSLKAVLVLGSMTIVGYAMAQIGTDLRLGYMRALLSASWSYFTNTPVGNISNAMSRESDRAAALLGALTGLVASGINMAILIALASLVSWQITVAAVVTGSIMLVLLNGLVGKALRAGRQEANAYASLSARLGDVVQGIKGLKAMAREVQVTPLLEREMREINSALRTNALSFEAVRILPEPILVTVMAVGLFAAVTYWNRPVESLLIMAFLFYRTAGQLGRIQTAYQRMAALEGFFVHMMERIAQATAAAEPNPGRRTPTLTRGIAFEQVSFAYGEGAVLDGVSFEVPAAKITALIGPSGSGKSTLIDLVLGFLRPIQGRILVDGISLDEVDLTAWRKTVGYVPQELFLFHDTIRANITLGSAEVTAGEIAEAIGAAGASEFVAQMPEGLETVVGERGSKLSGGQRQRIAIARALLHKPSLLILDEPTTALDPTTEAAICETLAGLEGRVTVLAISHQSAIADIASLLCRIDKGRVVVAPTPVRKRADGR